MADTPRPRRFKVVFMDIIYNKPLERTIDYNLSSLKLSLQVTKIYFDLPKANAESKQ